MKNTIRMMHDLSKQIVAEGALLIMHFFFEDMRERSFLTDDSLLLYYEEKCIIPE